MKGFFECALTTSFVGGYILGKSNFSQHVIVTWIAVAVFAVVLSRRFPGIVVFNQNKNSKHVDQELDNDSRFNNIQNLMDPQLTPTENCLKLLRYVLAECLSADLSEKSRCCLLYCVEVLETKTDDLCVPQALLETDALENFGVDDADCSVQEWLLSQFTRARSSISLEHSMIVREATSVERRTSDALITSISESVVESEENSPDSSKKHTEHSSETSEMVLGSFSIRKANILSDGKQIPRSFGYGVLFSGQITGLRFHERSSESLPFETSPTEKESILQSLEGIEQLDWDIFSLREASNGRELQVLGWHILRHWELDRKFGIEEGVLKAWLVFVESSYSACEYHNATHAADVLQTVHFMLTTGGARDFLGDHEVLSLLLAALVHDIGHDGFTNSFHKHRLTDRALIYNDQSIQENFHIWLVFDQMAERPDINILRSLSTSEFAEVRRMLILLVLATDMSKHFSLLQEIRALLELHGRDPKAWAESAGSLLCFLLHACDIAGQAKEQRLALIWATRIFAEFFHQGDVERDLGLPTSPLCDRGTTVISSAEIGFIKFIMQPTFELVAQLLPAAGEACLQELDRNLDYWRRREDSNARLRANPPDGVRRRATMTEAKGTGRGAGRFSPMSSPRRNVLQVSSRCHRSSVV